MNFTQPVQNNQEYFEIELPGLKLYDGLTSLKIKKITPFIHKRILSLANLEADASKFIDLLNELVLNYDINELNIDDLSYILYQIRLTCYSMIPIELRFTCPDCKKESKIILKASELEIKEQDKYPTIELENFGSVTMRYRKIKDDKIVEKFLKNKNLDKDDPFYRTLVVDALVLDNWKPLEEIWDLMEKGQITVQDTLKIESELINSGYGVQQKITFECKECHKEVTQEFELNLGDYFPPAIY